jgi:hypothetical protein
VRTATASWWPRTCSPPPAPLDGGPAGAARRRADAIVIGQNAVAGDKSAAELVAGAPCVVLVAPTGHRFRRPYATAGKNGTIGSPSA